MLSFFAPLLWSSVVDCCTTPCWKQKLLHVWDFIKLLSPKKIQYYDRNSEWFQYWNKHKQKKKSSSVLTGRKHTKIVRPGDRSLNRETPDKSGRFGRYVVIPHPPSPLSPSFNLYELHISESKIIKTKLLTQSKTESLSQQQYEHRSSGNIIQAHKKKLKEHYTRFKVITFPMEMYFQMFSWAIMAS